MPTATETQTETCQNCRRPRPVGELISTYWGGWVCRLSTKRRCVRTLVAQLDGGACWPIGDTIEPRRSSNVEQPSDLARVERTSHRPDCPDPAGVALRRRWARHKRRETEYVTAGRSLADTLDGLGADTERVYVSGSMVEASAELLDWATLPEGWEHGGHYLRLPHPIFRCVRPDGREVEVHRADAYFGSGVTPAAAAAGADELVGQLGDRFDGAGMLATPATTGRELILRSLPPGAFSCLADDHQDLIRSTSGQGRIEMLWSGGDLGELAEYDGRFMYAALCWGLGAGPAVHDDRPVWEPRARGRYRVRFTVPAGWEHVGILGVMSGDGWEYPTEGVHETWADGAELLVAEKHGWTFDVLERLLLADGKADPLRRWADRLVAAREAVSTDEARSALRSILLHGLGALHGRPSTVTKVTAADEVPADAELVRVEGDRVVWTAAGATAKWAAMSHPEWTSAVWARARARLLDGPRGVGALHVPRSDLVAFRTDAIYLAGRRPDWEHADDGKPGRFRLVGHTVGPMAGPTTSAELLRLKGEA